MLTVVSAPLPLVVLVAGDPIEPVRAVRGGFVEIIRSALGDAWPHELVGVDLRDESPLPDPEAVSGFVITGSSASVMERAAWMLRAEEYLRVVVRARRPVFGICFGHQVLAQALGGNVNKNRHGREIGTVAVELVQSDVLFGGLHAPFAANATHVDTVDVLPPGAVVVARTALEPHAALRFSDTAWGVQFHPEMDGDVVKGYISLRRDLLKREGLDPTTLLANAADTPESTTLLHRFARFVQSGKRALEKVVL
jgi:GMP synthase (glutamine-hydrolysing)